MYKALLIALLIFVATACTSQNEQSQNNQEPEAPSPVSLNRSETNEQFLVSENDVQRFTQNVQSVVSQPDFKQLQTDLNRLKNIYPEGYFVVIKAGGNHPSGVKEFYDTSISDEGSRINLLIHELTHFASETESADAYQFQKDNLALTARYNPDPLTQKGALRQYLETLTFSDETYLNDENGDIYGTLDELNAYTKSVRVQIAYEDIDPKENLYVDYASLDRQILHLALGLYHAKNSNPDEWKELTSNKSFAYLVYNFKKDAETELARVNTESAPSGEIKNEIQNTKEMLTKYESIFDDFFSESNIRQGERELSYTDINLGKIGIQNNRY